MHLPLLPYALCIAALVPAIGMAAPLPNPTPNTGQGALASPWALNGGGDVRMVKSGSAMQWLANVPLHTDKEKEVGGKWRGIVSLDLYGTRDSNPAVISWEAFDPASGETFAKSQSTIQTPAPRSEWTLIYSSEQGGAAAKNAIDGKEETGWHSAYVNHKPVPGPNWIGFVFGQPTKIQGLRYVPRNGGGNGTVRNWRLEILKDGEWVTANEGTVKQGEQNTASDFRLGSQQAVDGCRLVILSDTTGGGFGSATEISPIGFELKPQKPVTTPARLWLEIPDKLMAAAEGKKFGLRAQVSGKGAVVLGQPRFSRLHTEPSGKLFGRSNGGLGPDKLGAGLLGFDALTEHEQDVLSVMTVRPGSPAAKAKLKAGDIILAVDHAPLPLNDLNPGWEWFHTSHEARLGRATEEAFDKRLNALRLTVLRDGAPTVLELPINADRSRSFATMDPSRDPEAQKLLDDMLKFLVNNQKDNGSWSDDIIRTTFSSLALLSTRDNKHLSRVRKAVNWSLEKYPEPEKYGGLGFWSAGYAGILYSEWYLATGDERVLPHLDKIRDWAIAGQVKCKWDVPALGHGPGGLPYDNKGLVAPSCHLLVAEALATRCLRKSGIWELVMPYMELAWSNPKEGGHGSLGYNNSYKDTEEFWSRSGLFAIAAHLRNQRTDMRDAMTGFMRGHYPWFRNSHAYGEPGGSWGLLGLNIAAPDAYREIMPAYKWWFSLAWEPGYGLRFTTPHMGAPYMGEEDLINATYALVLQAPKKTLHLTGGRDQKWARGR